MKADLKIKLYSLTLDCPDPTLLAKFYAALMEWDVISHDEDYAFAYAPGTTQGAYPIILFQRNPDYVPPVWPDEPEAQQQMAHIDLAVNDLEAAVQHALDGGATLAGAQFSELWRTMLDPAGHPFCLCQMKEVMERADFALL